MVMGIVRLLLKPIKERGCDEFVLQYDKINEEILMEYGQSCYMYTNFVLGFAIPSTCEPCGIVETLSLASLRSRNNMI